MLATLSKAATERWYTARPVPSRKPNLLEAVGKGYLSTIFATAIFGTSLCLIPALSYRYFVQCKHLEELPEPSKK